MKTCKFCNAELPEDVTVCPSCGKDNAQKQTLSAGKTILAVAAVVAVLILSAAVLFGVQSKAQSTEEDAVTMEETVAVSEETTSPT